MTNVIFNLVDVVGEVRPGDTVRIWPPRVTRNADGQVQVTRPETINVGEGPVTRDISPGPLWVQIQAGGYTDTEPKLVRVPQAGESTDDVTLATLLGRVEHYDPVLESWAYENAGRAEQAALDSIAARDRSEAGAELSEDAAAVSVAAAVGLGEEFKGRLTSLEAMNGVSPESPVDGQTANLVAQPGTLTRGILDESFTSSDLTVSVADPRFGAVADWDGTTGTDNTAAIRAAISHARSLGTGAVVLYPQGPGRGYYVSETIEHGPDLSVDMRVPIYHPGGTVTVRFGSAGKLTDNTAEYKIRVQRTTQSDWTDPADVGAELINMARCKIDIPLARGFTTNIRLIGDGQGFVVCTTTLGLFLNGRYGIDLHSRNGGWVNSNLVLGGYVLNHVGLNKGKPRCAVRYSSTTNFYNDGNVFNGLVAELKVDDAEGAEVEVIRAEYAQSNQHTNVRSETSGPVAIRNLNDSRFNNISLAYSQTTVGGGIDNSAAVRDTGHVTELRTLDRTTALRSVWRIDEMHKKAATYNGTTNIHVPGVSWRSSGSATASRSMSGIDVLPEYIGVRADRAVGVFISTRDIKRLLLSAYTDLSSPGRWVIKAFDSNGESIAEESAVRRGAVLSLVKFDYFGGSWIASQGSRDPIDFTVSDDVDHVWVGLSGEPGNPALVTSIEVLTGEIEKVRAWQPWDDRGLNWGTTYPVEGAGGAYEVGRIIMNAAPAPGQPLGWVCTAAGSPGVWTPMQFLPSI